MRAESFRIVAKIQASQGGERPQFRRDLDSLSEATRASGPRVWGIGFEP